MSSFLRILHQTRSPKQHIESRAPAVAILFGEFFHLGFDGAIAFVFLLVVKGSRAKPHHRRAWQQPQLLSGGNLLVYGDIQRLAGY